MPETYACWDLEVRYKVKVHLTIDHGLSLASLPWMSARAHTSMPSHRVRGCHSPTSATGDVDALVSGLGHAISRELQVVGDQSENWLSRIDRRLWMCSEPSADYPYIRDYLGMGIGDAILIRGI